MGRTRQEYCLRGHGPFSPRTSNGTCKECKKRYYYRKHHLMYTYGITPEKYEAILASQGGVCAICRKPASNQRLSVDHDHKTGKVRGLLCRRCNVMLGYARDQYQLFHLMAEYLKAQEN